MNGFNSADVYEIQRRARRERAVAMARTFGMLARVLKQMFLQLLAAPHVKEASNA